MGGGRQAKIAMSCQGDGQGRLVT